MKIAKIAIYVLVGFAMTSNCKTPEKGHDLSEEKSIDSSLPTLDYSAASNLRINEEYVANGEATAFKHYALAFSKIHRQQQAQNATVADPSINYRGMHAKGHGCVEGEFEATPPEVRYKTGLFALTGKYKVTVRFSNGNGRILGDSERDLRGFALRVKVPGMKQVSGGNLAGVHDFLFTNAPSHHARDISELMRFTEAFAAGGVTKAAFLASHPTLAVKLLSQTGRKVDSLLNESYWGRSPFAFGTGRTVKFLTKPLQTVTVTTTKSDDNRLAEDLDAQFSGLSSNELLKFGVYAQFQLDPQSEPIEDHSVEWKTGEVKLAEVTFKAQSVARGAECENIAFNPWNVAEQHRSLGNMNRARKGIYAAAEAIRQEQMAR
ncbi:MAG: catalase [Proteobacteria bacterium]|nr:catalase [Pseudomonadota bacterium]